MLCLTNVHPVCHIKKKKKNRDTKDIGKADDIFSVLGKTEILNILIL